MGGPREKNVLASAVPRYYYSRGDSEIRGLVKRKGEAAG